jgi:hypothetical protein
MNPAINPMQLTGRNGANSDLNHNVEGGMGILDWAGSPSTFDIVSTMCSTNCWTSTPVG